MSKKYKSAIQEFVEGLFDNAIDIEMMTVEQAAEDLESFNREGWDLPEDITAEEYVEAWNELVEEYNSKEKLSLFDYLEN